jgi:hypothetical protein
MDRSYPKSRPTPQSITVAAHCTQVDGESAFGIARYRELVLTLGLIGAGNLKLGSFWQIRIWGLRASGPPSFAFIELGSFWQKYAWQPSLQVFPFLPSIFRFPDPSIKGYGTLVGVW